MPKLADVLQSALVLDPQERAMLAERLLASLDDVSEEEAERLWAGEAARRLAEYHAGRARVIDASEVIERAEKLIS